MAALFLASLPCACDAPEEAEPAQSPVVVGNDHNPELGAAPVPAPVQEQVARDVSVPKGAKVLIERDDLVAYVPKGIKAGKKRRKKLKKEIRRTFPDVDKKFKGRPKVVVYIGKFDFSYSLEDGGRRGWFKSGKDHYYFEGEDDYAHGNNVIWADMDNEYLFFIHYPPPKKEESDKEKSASYVLEGFTRDLSEDDFEKDEFEDHKGDKLSNRAADQRGLLFGKDSRHRVASKDKPVSGKLYQRVLDVGGGSGALIGRRHFVTAAHVLVNFEKKSGDMTIDDHTIRAGRNGKSRVGDEAKARHIFWLASWNPGVEGTERRGADLGWGVLDERLGKEAGFFGVAAKSLSDMKSDRITLRNLGYPSCSDDDGNNPPPDCIKNHLYLDSDVCGLGEAHHPDHLGWERAIGHTCDASSGLSGSPLVKTEDGSLHVWAVHSGHTDEKDFNYAARLTKYRVKTLISEMFHRYRRK